LPRAEYDVLDFVAEPRRERENLKGEGGRRDYLFRASGQSCKRRGKGGGGKGKETDDPITRCTMKLTRRARGGGGKRCPIPIFCRGNKGGGRKKRVFL